jgi:protein-S-isoprenylcysteine O-methyltransferase Ste14
MLRWLERWQQRDRELREGVDADLVRDNRKRWKRAFCLITCGLFLFGVQSVIKLSGYWHDIAVAITMIFFSAGFFLGYWARAEKAFLDKPTPEEPPRLWK